MKIGRDWTRANDELLTRAINVALKTPEAKLRGFQVLIDLSLGKSTSCREEKAALAQTGWRFPGGQRE